MNYSQQVVEQILKKVSEQKLSSEQAFQKLRNLSHETFSFAKIDHHRALRKNLPEVVYGPGKSLGQLQKIACAALKNGQPFLMTRVEEATYRKLKKHVPKLNYAKDGRIAYFKNGHSARVKGLAAIVTAGTSDIPVAEEAAITLETVGNKVSRFYDCGVAGLQRLLDRVGEIEKADVVICIAGMEGALPSVLAGLIDKPVIAVPTSVGYGASFEGLSALLSMLNSCAQGVAVVNIDSGFNAACFASLILNRVGR